MAKTTSQKKMEKGKKGEKKANNKQKKGCAFLLLFSFFSKIWKKQKKASPSLHFPLHSFIFVFACFSLHSKVWFPGVHFWIVFYCCLFTLDLADVNLHLYIHLDWSIITVTITTISSSSLLRVHALYCATYGHHVTINLPTWICPLCIPSGRNTP